ncbi:MAG: protein-L-isoaspartate(D-aspartate) O-methyltransferase, partial [Pseudomonadales bacterium]
MNDTKTLNQAALQRARDRLVDALQAKGVTNPLVLEALRAVPRHLFVEDALQYRAYEDSALPIGQAQTISQPYIVGVMTQALFSSTRPMNSVLEIGTGCGYQTAVLAELAKRVCTVERIRSLQQPSEQRLRSLGYRNIEYRHGDGFVGWRERGPFDGIMVTAAASEIPKMLV